jgi:hypothetical protein
MDLLQKYTGVEKYYELDDAVVLTLEDLDLKLATLMVLKIECAVEQIQEKDRRSQLIGGVIELNDPVYFSLRFIYEKGDSPYFFQISDITSDEYLDLYNLNKIIK